MNRSLRNSLNWIAALLCIVFGGLALQAQNTTAGAISGTVTDTTGAVLPNVQITVTNQATKQVSTATSSGKGSYTVENLPGGDYTIVTALAGFQQSSISDLHLDPGQRRGQDIKLALGSVDTKVNVQADTIAVQTESAESGGTISAKEVANLMLNGRNFQQLATLVPGVSSVKGANSQVDEGYLGQTNLIIGGSSVEQTTYTIDGVFNETPNALININITPSIDAINEMRVLKNAYSAKYGYAGSGQVLIETKSGTSAFHGSAYEYVRNNSIGVARPYSFTGTPTTSSSLHLNIFGFTLGGPIFIPKIYNANRDKTFFFAGAEFKTNHYASVLQRSEYTQAIRAGDLSSSYRANSCGSAPTAAALAAGCTPGLAADKYLTCDSVCQTLLAARSLSPATCFFKDANGVTNQIRPTCFDSASAYFINPANNFYPLPNLPQNNNGPIGNFINTKPELDSQNDTIYRIDHNFNDKNTLTLRYMHEEVNDIRPARNYNNPSPNPGATVYTPALNMLARWSYTITPSIINTASIAYTDQKVQLAPTGSYTIPSNLISQAFSNGDNRLPAVNTDPTAYWSWLGIGIQPNYSKTGDGIFSDDFSYVRDRHVIQAGGFYMWNILRANASAFSQGSFSFNGNHTGDVAADFLLGLLNTYSQSNVQRAGVFHQHWFELYAQDDFKVTPRLTLSYGVRYSFFAPTTQEGNQVTNFVPSAFDPSVAPVVTPGGAFATNPPTTSTGAAANYTTNGLIKACTAGQPCGFSRPKKGLFSPRVGFALRLDEQGKMSLHGGYGIGYTQVGLFQTSGLLNNSPYVSTPTYTNTQFSNPAGGKASAPGLLSLNNLDSSYQPAQVQSYSLTFEDEVVPHGILTLAYAGQVTHHIFSSTVDINFPLNTLTPNSATCFASASNSHPRSFSGVQFDPCLNAGNGPGAPQTTSNYYRPYRGYGSITSGISIGDANYNALQTGFIYRLGDLQLNLAYTYSKSLGDLNQTNFTYGFDSNISFQNPHNPGADYGRPSYDRPHVFTGAYVYELPFFRHSGHFLARELLSHVGTSGLATIESGYATTVSLSSSTGGLANRPDQIAPLVRHSGSGKKNLGQAPLYSYSSFAVPSFGYFGDSEPGVLRGPKEVVFATAINKTFPITERVGFQLRAEAFNVFNHVNINGINSTFSSNSSTNASSFGYANSAGDPRQMEFSGRISF